MGNINRVKPAPNFEEVYAKHIEIGERKYQQPGGAIPLSATEREQMLLHRWHRMAEIYGANSAIEEGDRILTYRQTNALANRIAHALIARNLPADTPVGLFFDIEGDVAVAILAVWKAGRFFTWLEARQPLARNQYIVEESGVSLLLTNRKSEGEARQLLPRPADILVIEEVAEDVEIASHAINPPIISQLSDPAYLIYTSGSTGNPKGTVELHRNLTYFVATRERIYQFGPTDRVAWVLYGVGFFVPITGALLYGGCLLPYATKYEGFTRFSKWLIDRRISYLNGSADVRTWLVTLDGSQQFPDLRMIALSSGPSYREHYEAIRRYLPAHCVFVSVYNSTEIRVGTMWLAEKDSHIVGRLLPNGYTSEPAVIEIWDDEDRSLPSGEHGEVVVCSPFVAAGYWKSPELTASKFGVDRLGRRYCRTGDLGLLDEQGCLWVLGRMDGQFKIRGNRVESAEVEDALRHLPNVLEAAVLHHGASDEERVLIGFVASPAKLNGNDLRRQLAISLPDYMVPATIVVLDELPRNPNGKVDRPALRSLPVMQRFASASELPSPELSNLGQSHMDLKLPAKQAPPDKKVHSQPITLGEQHFHPTGEHIPITLAEIELSALHRLEKIATRFGSNLALEEGDRSLTYAELNRQMNRLAHAIIAQKVPKESPVALLFNLESDALISIFSIWKASHFLVWLEPKQPLLRNQAILEDSGAPLLVTNRSYAALASELWPDAAHLIMLEDLADDLPITDPPITIDGDSPAYLSYTSGSTGRPKGVIELHRNLLAMLVVRQSYIHFSTHDRVNIVESGGGWSNPVFGAFLYGGCLLPYRAIEEGLTRFSQWLIDRRITIAASGPTLRVWLLSLDGSQQFPVLRALSLGSSPTYREHVQAYQRYLPDHCIMANTYSATEVRSCANFVMDKQSRIETRMVPAGYPTLHAAIEIWDDEDKPVPAGTTGEVVVFTPYAAQGYWKLPEQTAARFGVDAQGRRYYRMGDLGRLDEQGCLWVLGRKDGQVKIRGNRVETAEVELAVLEISDVQEVAVIHIGESDETRVLIAFVASQRAFTGNELRSQLATRLPDYMVLATIIVLEELPHNATGKIARALLREMAVALSKTAIDAQQAESQGHSETEKRITVMVNELLGGANVGPHDNFFDHGGHSLLAARLMLTIYRTFGVDLPPRDFFRNPTIAELALSVDRVLAAQAKPAPVTKAVSTLGIEAVELVSGSPKLLPVLLCLGGDGSKKMLMAHQGLVRRIAPQTSLYALVAYGTGEHNELYSKMENLVGVAVQALRKVQPHGPYQLIGDCIGGKLAFEMARVLMREGEQIAMLLLLDAPARSAWSDVAPATATWMKVRRKVIIWNRRIKFHGQQLSEMGWLDATRYVGDRLAAMLPASALSDSPIRQQFLARKGYADLLTRFEPTEPLAISATAVFSPQYLHYRARWESLVDELDVTTIGDNHSSVYQAYIGETAALIRKTLQAVQPAAIL